MPNYVLTLLYGVVGVFFLLIAFRWLTRIFSVMYAPPILPPTLGTTRVACIGDSITYGTLVRHRRDNNYPVQLGKLLGEKFSVRNFGANARAVQKAADFPYWKHKYFKLSSEYQPNIVIIMLGTNDSRQPNWQGVDKYLQDYRDMLIHYRSLASKPVVYAATPPAEFKLKNNKTVKYGMIQEAVDEMTAGIKKLAKEIEIEVIDINAATSAHPEYFTFDGVHANADGAKHIAQTVYSALQAKMV